MIRILYEDLRASHGSTLWCNQPRQAPRGPNLARRVPHRLHRLPAEKPLLGQGLPEPEAHRHRSCRFLRGQVRLICGDASVPPLPSPPLPQNQTPLAPPRDSIRNLGPTLGCLASLWEWRQAGHGPLIRENGAHGKCKRGATWPQLRIFLEEISEVSPPRSAHRVAGCAPPDFPRPLPRGAHRSSIAGSCRSGVPEKAVSVRAPGAPELGEGDGEAGELPSGFAIGCTG